ncbi:hypothetical protein [Flavobacterium sp. 25HG05S-40]|uniref:hypothetical protein n=1 Tax=Flavobacterium sp. 25HG05S-40 TaxID=3458682 RepID=UPI004044CFC7
MELKPKKAYSKSTNSIDMGLKIIQFSIAMLIILLVAFLISFISENYETWKHLQ